VASSFFASSIALHELAPKRRTDPLPREGVPMAGWHVRALMTAAKPPPAWLSCWAWACIDYDVPQLPALTAPR
jgi:hypothetical protein